MYNVSIWSKDRVEVGIDLFGVRGAFGGWMGEKKERVKGEKKLLMLIIKGCVL